MRDGRVATIRERTFAPLTIPVHDRIRHNSLADCRTVAERWRDRYHPEVAEEVEVLPSDQPTVYDLEDEDDAANDTSWFAGYLLHATPVLTELGVAAPRLISDFGTVLRTWVRGFLVIQTSEVELARVVGERNAAIEDIGRLRTDSDLLRTQLRESRADTGRLTAEAAEFRAENARLLRENAELRAEGAADAARRMLNGDHVLDSVALFQSALARASDDMARWVAFIAQQSRFYVVDGHAVPPPTDSVPPRARGNTVVIRTLPGGSGPSGA